MSTTYKAKLKEVLLHEGTILEVGSVVELDRNTFNELLGRNAIEKIDGEAAPVRETILKADKHVSKPKVDDTGMPVTIIEDVDSAKDDRDKERIVKKTRGRKKGK